MTRLAMSDIVIAVDDISKKVRVGMDLFVARLSGTWGGGEQSVQRLNNYGELVWGKHYFDRTSSDIRQWGMALALTKDEQYLYAAGASSDYDYNLKKLNASDGTIVWEVDNGLIGFYLMTLDAAGDIIVWGKDISGLNGTMKKYDSSGVLKWSLPLTHVTGIACDSGNNIFVTREAGVSPGLHKYDADGNYLSGASIAGDVLWDVKVDTDDNLIIAGNNAVIDSNNRQVFKFDTSLALLDSAAVGSGGANMRAFKLSIDSLRYIIALSLDGGTGVGYMDRINPSPTLFSQGSDWSHTGPYGLEWSSIALCTDVHNRIHFLKGYAVGSPSYRILNPSDGSTLRTTNRFLINAHPRAAICSSKIYKAKYTDRATMNYYRPDMCCFLDDSIVEFDHLGYGPQGPYPGTPYSVGTIIWCDFDSVPSESGYDSKVSQPEAMTGIFEVVGTPKDGTLENWPGIEPAYKQLNKTPPCGNANWDQYTDADANPLGGIGNCPQIYTVTFAGILNVSDSEASPYNGEYLLVRGPGIKGFFFGYEQERDLRINFTIQDSEFVADYPAGDWLTGDDKEKLYFAVGDATANVFKYESAGASPHDEKLTAVTNANEIDTEGALAYGGTASMYPGRRQVWDAITVWQDGDIVAWQGRFYRAKWQNQNSQPPSADWTVI